MSYPLKFIENLQRQTVPDRNLHYKKTSGKYNSDYAGSRIAVITSKYGRIGFFYFFASYFFQLGAVLENPSIKARMRR